MNGVDITSVTRMNKQTSNPGAQFHAKWLRRMGFILKKRMAGGII